MTLSKALDESIDFKLSLVVFYLYLGFMITNYNYFLRLPSLADLELIFSFDHPEVFRIVPSFTVAKILYFLYVSFIFVAIFRPNVRIVKIAIASILFYIVGLPIIFSPQTHSMHPVLLVTIILCFYKPGEHREISASIKVVPFFVFFAAGFSKLQQSGFDIFGRDYLLHHLYMAETYRSFSSSIQTVSREIFLKFPVLAWLSGTAFLILELIALPIFLYHKKCGRILIFVFVAFHFFVYALLDINFFDQLLIYIFWIRWTLLFSWLANSNSFLQKSLKQISDYFSHKSNQYKT